MLEIVVKIDASAEEEGAFIQRALDMADAFRQLNPASAEVHTESIGIVDLLNPENSEAIVASQVEPGAPTELPVNPSNSAYVSGEGGQVQATPSAPASEKLADPNAPATEQGAQATGPVVGEHVAAEPPTVQPSNTNDDQPAQTVPDEPPDESEQPTTTPPEPEVEPVTGTATGTVIEPVTGTAMSEVEPDLTTTNTPEPDDAATTLPPDAQTAIVPPSEPVPPSGEGITDTTPPAS